MAEQGHIKDKLTPDGKRVFQETSRPFGTKTYFTSEGDDTSNHPTTMTKVGGGNDYLEVVHVDTSDPNLLPDIVYADFNIAENRTFLHEGYIQWEGADGDTITLEVVPKVTTVTPEASTEFKLYNGYLITPHYFPYGTTEVNINGKTTASSLTDADVKLVYVPVTIDTGTRLSPAFWNAEYNTTTHEYENITPAPAGDGEYNMFSVEVPLERFANRLKLKKNGFMMLQTADTSELGQNMRVRLTGQTVGVDHDWQILIITTMHREKTV